MDYVVVADENLFHPERRIPPEKKAEAVLPKPEFVLFGTLIAPNLSIAYMEDKKAPVTTPGRGNRQTTLKKGELLSGFTLKEIMKDKVVMARGEETIQVSLENPGSPKKRETLLTTPGPQPQLPGHAPGGSAPAACCPHGGSLSRRSNAGDSTRFTDKGWTFPAAFRARRDIIPSDVYPGRHSIQAAKIYAVDDAARVESLIP